MTTLLLIKWTVYQGTKYMSVLEIRNYQINEPNLQMLLVTLSVEQKFIGASIARLYVDIVM